MSVYSQNFDLIDIFTNKELRGKLPIISYKYKDGVVRTRTKSISDYVLWLSRQSARPYYSKMLAYKSDDIITINGIMTGDIDACVDSVYRYLVANKNMLEATANDILLIRDALKEAEYNKRTFGQSTKLYLKQKSIAEIKNLNKRQIMGFIRDVENNIEYSGNYPKTLAKWGKWLLRDDTNSNAIRRKRYWEEKVGKYE